MRAVALGDRRVGGLDLAGTSAWYEIRFENSVLQPCQLRVTAGGSPGDSVVLAETGDGQPNLALAGIFSTTDSGTYFIQVTGGTTNQQFTLTASAA